MGGDRVGYLVLTIVLVILITLLTKRLRRRRARPPLRMEAPVPTFRVVALGHQGSGKTLLLASMYHTLRVPADQCYFLTAAYDDVVRLNQWFDQMANTASQDWPHSTTASQSRMFDFTVKTRTTGILSTIMHLNYLEYAGELLTQLNDSGGAAKDHLFATIRSADALVGVIDGYSIRQFLDGHPMGAVRLAETLNALVPAIIEASCPVNFVITKWDLLADLDPDENRRLSIVRNLLTSNPQFRALVSLHSVGRVVRLIPVSAVGPGFARIGNGGIVKMPGAEVRPTNVDIPLSAVVPDLFEQIEGRLDHQHRAALHAEVRKRMFMDPVEAVASLSAFATQVAGRVVMAAFGGPVAVVGDSLLGLFLDSRTDGTRDRQTSLDRQLSAAEEEMDQIHRARRRVLQDMHGKVLALESRLPYSRLSEGR
ncbi:MAG: hypothetical protein JWN00_4105 [Actinomycetia bacterium]|nr:hypothetical protein [Actinomycetes bacterium]